MAPVVSKKEKSLLMELAGGKKTFDQVAKDALRFDSGCRELKEKLKHKTNNISRIITDRLDQLTGITKKVLQYHDITMTESLESDYLYFRFCVFDLQPTALVSRTFCFVRLLASAMLAS